MAPTVGIIANPASARDIRRVVASATGLQIADRANIVLRVLAAVASCGIEEVLVMPETGGIRGHVVRGIERWRNQREKRYPHVTFLDMPVTGTVEDTKLAARLMHSAGVACIVVLGGDGTHRAVASECGRVPIAGISTGTNNAFPDHREPTITGLATGLAVMEHIPEHVAFCANKRLDVVVNGLPPEHALVDVALVTDAYVGARALWRTHTFRELYVTFADPQVIGMAGIAGLIEPVSRKEAGGLMMRLAPAANATRREGPDRSGPHRFDWHRRMAAHARGHLLRAVPQGGFDCARWGARALLFETRPGVHQARRECLSHRRCRRRHAVCRSSWTAAQRAIPPCRSNDMTG